jgi:hypothetical protein
MRLVGWPLAQTGARLLVHSDTLEFIHFRKFLSSSIAGRNAEGNGTFVEAENGKSKLENGKVKPGTRNSKSEARGTSLKIEIGNLKWGERVTLQNQNSVLHSCAAIHGTGGHAYEFAHPGRIFRDDDPHPNG